VVGSSHDLGFGQAAGSAEFDFFDARRPRRRQATGALLSWGKF
jgi:hypothetical protein